MLAIAFFVIAVAPQDDIIIDRVDMIEVNRYYDGQGKLIFTQLIFWDYSPSRGEFIVRDWRMMKCHMRRWSNGFMWIDERDQLRHVRGRTFFESWTQIDPEIENRKKLPVDDRRKLSR